VDRRCSDLFVGVATETMRSVQVGSEITASPGQPVGQYGPGYHPGKVGGTLRASWQLNFESAVAATISTNIVYAPPIEEGIGKYGPLTLRSTVGGFHSVKLTRGGFPRIVATVARQLGAA
jgi:hypothetical protein